MTGTDPLLAATAGEVEQGICREFLKRGFTADDPVLIDPDLISAVMTVVGPVLEAKDDEITPPAQGCEIRRVGCGERGGGAG